uniref:ZAD domain-containing protein n=1 Tax=Anopheles epiroticus TaxID=199890 RepID=A0A182P7P0_9DIPT
MEKLYIFCCRLCLHDGSTNQLLEILSVKGLKEKIANIFNIEIASHDACTKNICLACFNETLNMEKQFRMYEEQKRTILDNQLRLQENSPETTGEVVCAPMTKPTATNMEENGDKNTVSTPERSSQGNLSEDKSPKTKRSANNSSGVNLEERDMHKSKSITQTSSD